MITEAYVKSRYDFGIGKCAVLIVEGGVLVGKHVWTVKQPFVYNGIQVTPNQYDLEILAAIWAVRWCREHGRKLVNIYTNTTTCQKWYMRRDFPDTRPFGSVFTEEAVGMDVFAEYIPKADDREFNRLMNELAEKAG